MNRKGRGLGILGAVAIATIVAIGAIGAILLFVFHRPNNWAPVRQIAAVNPTVDRTASDSVSQRNALKNLPATAVAIPANPQPAEPWARTPFEREVLELAQTLSGLVGDPIATDLRVHSLASRLDGEEAQRLAALSSDPEADHSARFLAVTLLAEQAARFHQQLEEIARTEPTGGGPTGREPIAPHSLAELENHFSQANRIAALAALDRLGVDGPSEASYFSELKDSSRDPLIRKVASMGYTGAQNGIPLINRYIEAK